MDGIYDSSDVETGIYNMYVVLVHYKGMIGMQFRNSACAEFGETVTYYILNTTVFTRT